MPFIVAILLCILLLFLSMFANELIKKASKSKRLKYKQILIHLDHAVELCNKIYSPILRTRDLKLIDYFCGTLSVLENLLATVSRMSVNEGVTGSFNGALFLTKDCYLRCKRVERALKEFQTRGKCDYNKLYDQFKPGGLNKIGCYFCSRPYEAHFFTQVVATVDQVKLSVIACRVCQYQLEKKNKARILKFIRNGKAYHWSQVPDFKTDKKYWTLNLENSSQKSKKHLSLLNPPLE